VLKCLIFKVQEVVERQRHVCGVMGFPPQEVEHAGTRLSCLLPELDFVNVYELYRLDFA